MRDSLGKYHVWRLYIAQWLIDIYSEFFKLTLCLVLFGFKLFYSLASYSTTFSLKLDVAIIPEEEKEKEIGSGVIIAWWVFSNSWYGRKWASSLLDTLVFQAVRGFRHAWSNCFIEKKWQWSLVSRKRLRAYCDGKRCLEIEKTQIFHKKSNLHWNLICYLVAALVLVVCKLFVN